MMRRANSTWFKVRRSASGLGQTCENMPDTMPTTLGTCVTLDT
jgi:hypothetical protein